MNAYGLIKIAAKKKDNDGMNTAEKAALATMLAGGTVAGVAGSGLGEKAGVKLMDALANVDYKKASKLREEAKKYRMFSKERKNAKKLAQEAQLAGQRKSNKASDIHYGEYRKNAKDIAYGGGALAAAGGAGVGYEEYKKRH